MSTANIDLSKIDIETLPTQIFFGNVMYDTGGTYGPRVQTKLQLVTIGSGDVIITIDNVSHHLTQGEVALLKPGHQEYFEFSKTERTYHNWCDFTWKLPASMAPIINQLPFKTNSTPLMERLIDLGLTLDSDEDLTPAAAHLAAAAFWEFINRASINKNNLKTTKLPDSLIRVKAYIKQNYFNDINLNDLSKIAYVTPEHLTRLFNKHLHTSPMRYVWKHRVHRGISFLKHSNLTIERIAFNCGFKTAAHFSRTVKHYTGQTPRSIRTHHH